MRFDIATARRIVFGAGALREVAPAAKAMGARALLVSGRTPRHAARLVVELHAAGVGAAHFPIDGEPTLDVVTAGVAAAKRDRCNFVIACGGGSSIDAGKAIAALLTNPGELLDYLEVVGKGKALPNPSAPFIAVPTTAGTGSEVTRNAVLASPGHRVKASLRSPHMLPALAVVDPELTLDLPSAVTASTGLDALTQVLEPFTSIRANPMTDAWARDGLRQATALRRTYDNGKDVDARTSMAYASLLGGLCLANSGLGAVHGFAAPIGGMFPAPHGAVCAALLPHCTATNLAALRARQPESPALARYDEAARILIGDQAQADDLVPWLMALTKDLGIPGLGSYGLSATEIDDVCEKAAKASSMKANPIVLTAEELRQTLAAAL
ncbi:iron-containing alcohol dehydrogenase [Paludibaculum fermentans]|uniref:iron-containing alcohol dehydrogenase n=1 Tax=Paludibaculum fermentans TaxID=1473598 RepID=UPI003EC0449A